MHKRIHMGLITSKLINDIYYGDSIVLPFTLGGMGGLIAGNLLDIYNQTPYGVNLTPTNFISDIVIHGGAFAIGGLIGECIYKTYRLNKPHLPITHTMFMQSVIYKNLPKSSSSGPVTYQSTFEHEGVTYTKETSITRNQTPEEYEKIMDEALSARPPLGGRYLN